MTRRRRTPLDPYPEPRPAQQIAEGTAYPPGLGTDAVAVLEGRTFMLSDAAGDVPTGSVGGLLHDDTRFVSCWELTLDGGPLSVLKSGAVDYYSAAFFLTNPDLPGMRANTLTIRRLRFVGDGLSEQIAVYNPTPDPVRVRLRLSVGSDFADLFEVKSSVRDRARAIEVEHDTGGRAVHFRFGVPGFVAESDIRVARSRIGTGIDGVDPFTEAVPWIDDGAFVWDVELGPRRLLDALVRVTARLNERSLEPMHADFGERQHLSEGALTSWLAEVPRFRCESALLGSVLERSILDLAALRIEGDMRGEHFVLPAAGLPWFMTLFGRDTLITSWQTVGIGPELARGALHLLGELQGTAEDDFRDEEPGKILHEIRYGELTVTGEKPHSPYYGTADATPLYLRVLSSYWNWTGDDDFVRARWPRVLAALGWIDRFGDRDGDGYVEYETKSSEGLGNQCWKDSWDGIQFADGRIPYLPIATAEIQGYVYDAKLRVAGLAEHLMRDERLAGRLRDEASALFDRFNRDFWSDDRGGYYVIGLDGDKRQIDPLASNMGHLLWSGIVPDERAEVVARHLMSDAMFSGWGVRTLSTEDAGYNPIGYHTGTVWPHDNAIVASGLERYGFRDDANRIALAQLEAAASSGFRLPEAMAGLRRDLGRFPVPYPTACSPQAWATGAPFVFLGVMLGLHAVGGRVTIDPHVPPEIGRIFVHGLHVSGTHWDVDATGDEGRVSLTH
ncbi:MAG TPA: glycogen debranching N-terminal domain-containing protein [Actinomycetota bacterium]|nr:glycogen debranching N-terminal domain-containing protein [Actinomycetota bacterium]